MNEKGLKIFLIHVRLRRHSSIVFARKLLKVERNFVIVPLCETCQGVEVFSFFRCGPDT